MHSRVKGHHDTNKVLLLHIRVTNMLIQHSSCSVYGAMRVLLWCPRAP